MDSSKFTITCVTFDIDLVCSPCTFSDHGKGRMGKGNFRTGGELVSLVGTVGLKRRASGIALYSHRNPNGGKLPFFTYRSLVAGRLYRQKGTSSGSNFISVILFCPMFPAPSNKIPSGWETWKVGLSCQRILLKQLRKSEEREGRKWKTGIR